MVLYCTIQHHECDTIRKIICVTREKSVLEQTKWRYNTKTSIGIGNNIKLSDYFIHTLCSL